MSEKLESIKKAAISLFSRRGYDGTTVPLIAEQASVGAGTIYRYFDNKEKILNVIIQEELSRLEQKLKANYPDKKSIKEQFSHLFFDLIRYSQENFDSFMLIESHVSSRHLNDKAKSEHASFFAFISSIAEQGRHQGVLNKNLPNGAIVSIVFGVVVELAKSFDSGDLTKSEELLENLEESIWRAISS